MIMELKFNATCCKQWGVTDDYLIYGKSKIPYSEITDAESLIETFGGLKNGVFRVKNNGKELVLGYSYPDKEKAKIAFKYILDHQGKTNENKEKVAKIEHTFNSKTSLSSVDIFIILILTAVLIPLLYKNVSPFVIAIILLLLFGMVKLCINIIHKKICDSKGIEKISDSERRHLSGVLLEKYEFAKSQASESPKERYSINSSSINQAINIGKQLANSDIVSGQEMQKSKGPQKDWAITGGLVEGVAGGVAGIAAAGDVMRQNMESTEKYHQMGKDIENRGRDNLKRMEEAQNEISSTSYCDFNYTNYRDDLIKYISYVVNDVKNYGAGFVEASISFKAIEKIKFPNSEKEAHIDGSVMIEMWDKEEKILLAEGYYVAPSRFGNDKKKTGFSLQGNSSIVIMKELVDKPVNKNNGYIIKLSRPKLWLLEL